MPGKKPGLRLAADANVLLSALIGGRARVVFGASEVQQVLTTQSVIDEVREFLPVLAETLRRPRTMGHNGCTPAAVEPLRLPNFICPDGRKTIPVMIVFPARHGRVIVRS